MTDTRKRWVIYYDETMEREMKRLRTETAKKDGVPVKKISIRRVVSDTTHEKYVEYEDKQNNRARITTLVEGQVEMKQEIASLRAQVERLTEKILALTGDEL